MRNTHTPHLCLNCNEALTDSELYYSVNRLGHPLCPSCQQSLKSKLEHTSRETVKLYFLLKQKGIAVELEKDGNNSTDIAIANAKVNIEVDQPQTNYNRRQVLADLKRTYYSFEKGYYTLRIPNGLVAYDQDDAVSFIEEFLQVSCQPQSYYHC
jgi:very-short-patch-repair endonuclease